jgi:anti-sigma factor (TIGR02949 family)
MDCSEIADRLSPFLDGELEGDEAEGVGMHLEECASCKKRYQDHQWVKEVLARKLSFQKAPPRFRSDLLDRLGTPTGGGSLALFIEKLRARPLMASGLAMCAVVILASVVTLMNSVHIPPALANLLHHSAEAFESPLDVSSADVGFVSRRMSRALGKKVKVPDLTCKRCTLEGARQCPDCECDSLEARYRHPAGKISFYMFSDVGKRAVSKLCKSGSLRKKSVDGRTYLTCNTDCGRFVLWMEKDDVCVVVSDFSVSSACPFDIAGEIRKDLHW